MNEHYIFVVFYRHHGEDYSAVFQGMRKAKAFARLTGGRVECQLSNVFNKKDQIMLKLLWSFIVEVLGYMLIVGIWCVFILVVFDVV